MTPAARISAAIEVLADIDTRRRPAADALKDWGLAHRFAGSGDRAAIAGLLYDALRRKASSAFIMGERHAARGAARHAAAASASSTSTRSRNLADGGRFAPSPLTDAERARLDAASLDGAPPWVAGDYPEWLDPQLAAHLRRRARRGRRGAGVARAARSAGQHAQGDARRGARRARRSCADADALVAAGLAHRARRRCPQPGGPCRAGLHQGPDRDPGRRLAACRAARRRQARPAGDRSLRRRRRQDAGARGRDGEQGPALRHRRRQAPPGADPCTGSNAPACATCRSARRAARATCSPISTAMPISC